MVSLSTITVVPVTPGIVNGLVPTLPNALSIFVALMPPGSGKAVIRILV